MLTEGIVKALKALADRHGFGVVVAIALMYAGHSYLSWTAANVVVPVVQDHREFLRNTTKAIEAGAESQRRTADAMGEIRSSLDEMRGTERSGEVLRRSRVSEVPAVGDAGS